MSENQTEATKPAPKPKRPPAEVTKVTMTDGREVEFVGAKKRMDKESFVDEAAGTVTVRFDFRNGETRSVTLQDPTMLLQAAAHGVSQKVGDETAGDDKIEDMVLHVEEMIERLTRGEWARPKAEGESFSGASLVVKALVLETKKTPAEVKELLALQLARYQKLAEAKGGKFTRKDLYDSFRNPATAVGKTIKRLEEEALSAEAKADGDALLGELMAG